MDAKNRTNTVVADGNKIEENRIRTQEHLSTQQRNCVWWNRRTSLERSLVAVASLLLVTCIVLIIVNVITEERLRIAEIESSGTCRTEECIKAAARLLEKMDPVVDPCDDFYQFACGTYLRKHTVPDDHYHRSTIQGMQDDIFVVLKKLIEQPLSTNDSEAIVKVKKLYTSCMNTSNIEDGSVSVLLRLLSESGVGEWPILDTTWNKSEVDLEWRLAMLYVHAVQPFFHTYVAPDDRNSSVYLLHVYSGSPILNVQYYLNRTEANYARYLDSYRQLISETVRLLGAPESLVKRDMGNLIQFEVAFANLTQDDPFDSSSNETNPLDDDFVFNKVNVSALEEMIPEMREERMIGVIVMA